VDRNMSECVM